MWRRVCSPTKKASLVGAGTMTQDDGAESLSDDPIHTCVLTIVNNKGLHARAAAKFVKLASEFDAQITVIRDNTCVDGRSIMGLLMLAAGRGTILEVHAKGEEGKQAIMALKALVEAKFHEN